MNTFSQMDAWDDHQIVSGSQNQWYYDVLTKDGITRSLSKTGVDACVRYMLKQGCIIREESIQFIPDPSNSDYVLFTALACLYHKNQNGQETKLNTAFGSKRQCRKTESLEEDPFWFEKGCQKALRNAKLKLIPPTIQNHIIKTAVDRELGQCINEDKCLEYLQQHQGWINEYLPFAISVEYIDGKRKLFHHLTWKQMANLPEQTCVCTKSKRKVKIRQYWHMLENYDHPRDRWLRYKAKVALQIFDKKSPKAVFV